MTVNIWKTTPIRAGVEGVGVNLGIRIDHGDMIPQVWLGLAYNTVSNRWRDSEFSDGH